MAKNISLLVLIWIMVLLSCNRKDSVKNNQPANAGDTTVVYLDGKQLDSILFSAFKDTSSGQNLGEPRVIGQGQSGEQYYLIKRTSPGFVEMHQQWDDVAIIRSGHGILQTGQKVEGQMKLDSEAPSKNWHGGTIIDPTVRKIAPGDFIIIPAMTAHQYIPDANDSLTYWTIKIKRVNDGVY